MQPPTVQAGPAAQRRFWGVPHARIAFLNYRHADEPGCAHAVDEYLRSKYPGQVWFDVDNESGIPLGQDWERDLDRKVRSCSVMLTLIGPRWTTLQDSSGRRRLEDPNDWVRREIRLALEMGKPVIPVLLEGAPLPTPEELPEDISPILKNQARRIHTGPGFQPDCAGLAQGIRGYLYSRWYYLNLLAAITVLFYLGMWLWSATTFPELGWAAGISGALLITLLTLLRKLEVIQTVRACLSYGWALTIVAVLAAPALLTIVTTAVRHIDPGGSAFTLSHDSAKVTERATDGIRRFNFWHEGAGVGLVLRTEGYPPACLRAAPVLWPLRIEPFHIPRDLVWSAAVMQPTPRVCEAVGMCMSSPCRGDDLNAIRLEISLVDNHGAMIAGQAAFQYLGQILWIGSDPPPRPARLSDLRGCRDSTTALSLFKTLPCGIDRPITVRYRWSWKPGAWEGVTGNLGDGVIAETVRPGSLDRALALKGRPTE